MQEKQRVGMERKRRRVATILLVGVCVLLGLWLLSPAGWRDLVLDRSQVESEESVGRGGVADADRTPEGRSAAADPESRRVRVADIGSRVTLRWAENEQLVADLSLRYGSKPPFVDAVGRRCPGSSSAR